MTTVKDLMTNIDISHVPSGHRLVTHVNAQGELVLTMYRKKSWLTGETSIPQRHQSASLIQREVNKLITDVSSTHL
jgi:hypothetical protein